MSSTDTVVNIAFDLYGTVLDTSSIAKLLEKWYGDKSKTIASQWRRYQLEYTWRLNSLNAYEPFSSVTKKALFHAVREIGESISSEQADQLMKAYDSLDTFPDVDRALKTITEMGTNKINPLIFSNGTRQMVEASLTGSPSLRTQVNMFSDIVVIDEIPSDKRRYKPSPIAYEYLVNQLKVDSGSVWLVTSNPFDVDGAKRFGIRVCWVDRQGFGWIDGIGVAPDFVCNGVDQVVENILSESKHSL